MYVASGPCAREKQIRTRGLDPGLLGCPGGLALVAGGVVGEVSYGRHHLCPPCSRAQLPAGLPFSELGQAGEGYLPPTSQAVLGSCWGHR